MAACSTDDSLCTCVKREGEEKPQTDRLGVDSRMTKQSSFCRGVSVLILDMCFDISVVTDGGDDESGLATYYVLHCSIMKLSRRS